MPAKKSCHAASSTNASSVASGHNVWADLQDHLLHQIVAFLTSFSDILAFAGTCRSWCAAFASFPSTLNFNIPPLYLQSHIRYPRRDHSRTEYSLLYNCDWQLTDPVKRSSYCLCSLHCNHPNCMHYLGFSYGNLIFSNSNHQCLLVDVFSGTTVGTPQLKSPGNHEIYCGILDGPLNSPNSHLFICSISSIFQWQVGSNSWLEHPFHLGHKYIVQFMFFNGEMFARDNIDELHTIHLAPQPSIHEVEIDWMGYWGEEKVVLYNVMDGLVVCGVFRLDFSIVHAKWVKMENLGDNAIFVRFDWRSTAFCCTSPERWRGKSNYIYVMTQSENSDEPWAVVELGRAVSSRNWMPIVRRYRDHPCRPYDLWVLPSLVYSVGQSIKPF